MRVSSFGAAAASLAATVALWPDPTPGQAAPPDPFKETDVSTVVEPQRRVDGFVFRFEEDAFLKVVPSTDRNYTGGGTIGLSGAWVKQTRILVPLDLVDRLLGLGPFHVDGGGPSRTIRRYGAEFGIVAFTPRDLTNPDVDPGDRPYASLDYLQVSRLSAYEQQGVALTTELRVGALGLDQAHQIQAAIHRQARAAKGCDDSVPTCSPHDPKGWSHQVSAGGEPTLGYGVQLERLLLDRDVFGVRTFDLKATYRADAGHLTSAAVGGMMRLGLVQSPFWAFNPTAMATTTQVAGRRVAGPWSPDLYLFAALDGRATLYNAMLQGQFRHSDRRVSWNEMRHFLYDYSLGVTGALRGFSVTWVALAGRSPEADFRETRHHQWASFFVGWSASD